MPAVKQIDNAAGPNVERSRSWWAVVPALGLSLLPNVTCPACWPAYAALLSSLGVSFVPTSQYLFPLTLVFVALALVAMGWRAPRRRGFGPLTLGLTGAALLITGRFVVSLDWLHYAGTATFISAALWNGWPRQTKTTAGTELASDCPNCRSLVSLESRVEKPIE